MGSDDCKGFTGNGQEGCFYFKWRPIPYLVRGRHNMPTIAEHALDKEFVELVDE